MYGYIYKTTCVVNNKIYIGQKTSSTFLVESYLGSGTLLKKAVKKYGKENFYVELISECNSAQELNETEVYWIAQLNSIDKSIGYNIAVGGQGGSKPLSDETKNKISKANKWKKLSNEQIEFLRKINTGRPSKMKGKKLPVEWVEKVRQTKLSQHRHLTVEQKEYLSKINKGKTLTEEHKQKISKALTGRPTESCSMYGKHHSEETKKKMSDTRKGIKYSQETLNKMSKSKSKCVMNFETGEIFESVKDAQLKYSGNIYNACYNPQKTAKGYHWSYVDTNGNPNIQPIPKDKPKNIKSVQNIETGEVFSVMAEASRVYNAPNIVKCCKGKAKTSGGYHWKYYEQQ